MTTEGRPGHDAETVFGQPRDGEVALDPPTLVEHLRVGDRADLARDLVVTKPLEKVRCSLSRDLDLGERSLVEQGRGRAAGDVLRSDRR